MDANTTDLDAWMLKNEYNDGVIDSIVDDYMSELIRLSDMFGKAAADIEDTLISISMVLEDKGIIIDTSELADIASSRERAENIKEALYFLAGDCYGD